MRKLPLNLLAAVSSLLLLSAVAQADNPAPPKPMTVDGHEGTWFNADSARRLLKLEDDYKTLSVVNEKLVQIILLHQEEKELMDSLNETALEIARVRKEQLGLEREQRISAERQRDAWYRSPTLWFSLGLTAATSVALLAR